MASPNRPERQQFTSIAGQASLYNLAFDEVHNRLENAAGKPLNAMNLDELRNVIAAEEGQLVPNPSSSSSSSSSAPLFLGNVNLNGALSKKTADEVWKDIVNNNQEPSNAMDSSRQQLGETTTLEDFLARAGVIKLGNHQNGLLDPDHPLLGIDPMVVSQQEEEWLQYQVAATAEEHAQQQQPTTASDSDNFHVSEAVYDNLVVDVGYSENQMAMTLPMPALPATSSESQTVAEKKRRYSNEIMEKTIERRQKRMIKNRESAARSRARKQAYTNQLEHEVLQLRKANSWLTKQKEVEKLLSCDLTPMPRYQLRRTGSAPF
ncbi:hypothetical protein Tsubulata_009655 [Turnera subulata]|uniref:BZIP domain-containing protein n=1 Tax=Turnera subulata TaxID=218843 RepID=A0A9Q0GH38_9ROSI|nr:hypothetical protein Tsubulata_009655 [Turnera subulata]